MSPPPRLPAYPNAISIPNIPVIPNIPPNIPNITNIPNIPPNIPRTRTLTGIQVPGMSGLPATPKPAAIHGKAHEEEFRTWTDSTGMFTTEAAFLDFKEGKVRLTKKDGQVITVAVERLSESDRALLKTMFGDDSSKVPGGTKVAWARFVLDQRFVDISEPKQFELAVEVMHLAVNGTNPNLQGAWFFAAETFCPKGGIHLSALKKEFGAPNANHMTAEGNMVYWWGDLGVRTNQASDDVNGFTFSNRLCCRLPKTYSEIVAMARQELNER